MSEIICPNCQSRQPAEAVFCDNCGHSLASPGTLTRGEARPTGFLPADPEQPAAAWQTCAACRAQNMAEAHFCDQCGTPLGAPTEPRPDLTAARRGPQPREAPTTVTLEETKPEPAPPRQHVAGRLVLEPTGTRLDFPADRLEVHVGREDPVSNIFPEIDLTPYGGEAAGVSRRHARFRILDGMLVVEDLDSTNFTLVNRRRVLPGAHQAVRNGDELRFGRITARYEEI